MSLRSHNSILVLGAAGVVALVANSCSSSSSSSGFEDGGGASGSGNGSGSPSGSITGTGSVSGTGGPSGSSSGIGSSGAASGSGSGSGSSVSGSGTSGSAGGGTGSTTGAASGSAGSGSAPSDGGTGSCSAKVASGAIMLTSNYVPASVIGMGGYAFAYTDKMGSTACVDMTALCAAGTTAVADTKGTIWGAGLGLNLNQMQATSSASPPVNTFQVTGAGIGYTLSNLPTQGMRIIIDDGGMDYCAPLTSASGTAPWSGFNTKCWDNSGTVLSGAPKAATHIQFQVTANAMSTPFDFCVTQVAFSTSASSTPDAGTRD